MSSQGLSRRHVVVVRLFVVFLLVLVTTIASSAFEPTSLDMRPATHLDAALDVDDTMAATPRRLSPRSTAGPIAQPEPPLPAIAARRLEVLAPTVTATKVDSLFTDVDGDTNADPGDVLQYVVTIGVTGMDATGVTFNDTIDPNTTLVPGSINTSPLAIDDSYSAIGNVSIAPNVAQGMLANDTDADGNTLTVTAVNTAGTQGQVTFNPNGSFTFNPNPGFEGTTTFTYTISDGIATNTGTVSINVSGMIWFVNSAAGAGGDGRIATPFNTLTGAGSFNAVAADDPGDNIFLYSGAYTGGFSLLNSQRFLGAGASETLAAMTGLTVQPYSTALPSTGGTAPTVTSAGNTVTLNVGNHIKGMTLGNATNADILGLSFGTLTVRDVALNGTGRALNLTSGTLDAVFSTISSSTSSSQGVLIQSVGGSLDAGTGTTVTDATLTGIYVQSSTAGAVFNFRNTSVTNPDADATGDTCVRLVDNSGSVTFGTLTLSPETGQRGLYATHGTAAAAGTITATSGAITATNAIAVEVNRSTAGTIPLALVLTSVTASGGSNGIFLSSTSGSFSILGDGTNVTKGGNASGGTISNMTGADGATSGIGVYLNNATNVSLRRMTLSNFENLGIFGLSVTGFTFQYGTVTGTIGTSSGSTDAAIAFGRSNPGGANGLFGTSTIDNCIVNNSIEHQLEFYNQSGSFNLTISNCDITDNTAAFGSDGILSEMQGTASATISVQNCFFDDNKSQAMQGAANDSSSMDVTVNNCTITRSTQGNEGLVFSNGSNGDMTAHITNNTITGIGGVTIFVGQTAGNATASSLLTAVISGNTITHPTTATNSAIIAFLTSCNGGVCPLQVAPANILIQNNNVTQNSTGGVSRGIFVDTPDTGTTPGFTASVIGNTVSVGDNVAGVNGIALQSRRGAGCFDVRNNTVTFPNGTPAGVMGLRVRQVAPGTAQLEQGVSAGTAATVLAANNLGATTEVLGTVTVVANNICATAPTKAPDSTSAADEPGRSAKAWERPLVATHGMIADGVDTGRLTQEELNWTAFEAIERWRLAGLSEAELARLHAVTFEIADLPDGQLGDVNGNQIRIDETGAGYGWFIDGSTADDAEFEVRVPRVERQATELSPAHGKLDLLTAMVRELGRINFEGKKRIPAKLRAAMQDTLSEGVRRLPPARRGEGAPEAPGANKSTTVDVPVVESASTSQPVETERPVVVNDPAASRLDDERSGETITKNIGTVPAGKTVTVTFRVTIDTPFPVGVCTVSNQGTISGSNFANVLTDDPAVGGAADPTMTTIPIPPVIGACPANITVSNTTGVCGAAVTFTPPTATGCPVPTVTCVPASGSTFAIGTTTVTCTAANSVLPNSTCSFTVTVNDTQAPTVTCPANITQPNTAGQCSRVVTYTTPTASDNCPGATVACVPASGSTFPVGATTVTCTATDASANTGSCSFTVTIQDTQAPTVTCPANITQPATAGQCSAVVTYTTPTASDNCPGATVVCAPASGATFPVGVTTVTCTASDASPNSPDGTCSFTVTIQDTQVPTVTCPANITTGNTAGQCSAVVTYTTPTASDNCPGATVVCVPASGATFPVGSTTVTCTATDASANTGSCSFSVTVNDTQAPSVTCPANITAPNTANQCSAVVTYTTPTGTDNCPGVVTVSCVPASGSTFPVGTTTVTCTASDVSANSPDTTCTFTVTIQDTQAPTVTCPANITLPNTAGQCSRVVTYTTPAGADNCPGVTVSCAPASGSTFPVGTTTVTCTASDASPNSPNTTCTFTVTIQDTQAPTVTCPSNITVVESPPSSGSATVTFTVPTASDNCPGATVVCVPASGSSFAVGTTTVTCTATDAAANTGSCTFTITVQPACTITCPANVTVPNTTGQCGATVNYAAPTTTGVCGTVTCVPASGSFFAVGTTTVNCSTTSGPTCSFTVTVQDTQAPVANCPAPITVPNAAGQCSAVVSYTATASDNCPGATIACVPASGSTFPVGTTTVTCTATDAAANTGTCSFGVTVQDTQAPAITCPANMTVPKTPGQCSTAVSYTVPTPTDNCPGATASCTPASGSTFPVGVTTVTCTATDASPNSPDTTCTFTITVTDTTAPVITCPANVTVPNATGQCSAAVNYAAPTTSDNCPGTTVVCTPASGSTFPVGATTVNCTATDASNNTSSCSFTVTVQDTQAPVATCPAPITVAAATGTCTAVVNYTATATDNCPGVTIVCAPASGSTFPVGVTTVNCTASDASPNSPDATCAFTVTVQDTQLPAITCPANIVVTSNTTTGCTFTQVVNYPAPTATDNCGLASVVCVPPSGSTFNEGTTTVVCTATDTSGNTAACSFTVTVGAAFGFCSVDDATGNRFQMVVNPASPSYGVWRFTVVATNTTYCGKANYVSYIAGVKLRAYDNDYSAENPTYFMDANFKGTTGTVTVRNVSGTVRLTLRDRNLLDSVCP